MLDPSIFSKYKSKQDFDLERQEFEQRKRQQAMQEQLGQIQLQQAQKSLNTPDKLGMEQLIAKSIQSGGVGNLSPQEQAQLQAFDIAQRTKQSVDPRGNVITNRSVYDMLPSQVNQMPPSQVMGMPTTQGINPNAGMRPDSGYISPTTQNIPLPADAPYQDIASMPDLPSQGLPDVMVDPNQIPQAPTIPMPDVSGLSPYKAEDVIADWKRENMELQRDFVEGQAQKSKEQPRAELSFNTMRDDTQNMINTIDKAIDQTSGWSAGMGSLLTSLPASDAKNLESTLSTIRADSAFSTLQAMREASKTGGALGAISERELTLLQNARTALDQDQDPQNLRENLENYKRIRTQALKNVAEGFNLDYGYYPKGLNEFVNQQQSTQSGWGIKRK